MRNFIVIILLVVLPSIIRAQTTQDYFERGNKAYEAGDYTLAFTNFSFAAENGHEVAAMKVGEIIYDKKINIVDYEVPLKWFSKYAKKGNSKAMFYMGMLLTQGFHNVPQDFKEGIAWFQKSASLGDATSINNLGTFYLTGPQGALPRDVEKAKESFEKAWKMGNKSAVINLANLYTDPALPLYDLRMTEKLYREALAAGNVDAYMKLARLYLTRNSIFYDTAKAVKMLREGLENKAEGCGAQLGYYYEMLGNIDSCIVIMERAIQLGDVTALPALAEVYFIYPGKSDDKKGIALLEKAADRKNIKALNQLGIIYTEGKRAKKDTVKAVLYFMAAMLKGSLEGFINVNKIYKKIYRGDSLLKQKEEELLMQFVIRKSSEALHRDALMLSNGSDEIEADHEKAFKLYEAAVAMGNAGSMVNLGNFYADGRYVTTDFKKAIDLYRRAMQKNEAGGFFSIALMHAYGEGMKDINGDSALYYYSKAVDLGSADAACNLGQVYFFGNFDQKEDMEKARMLFSKGVAWGHPRCMKYLGIILAEGLAGEKDLKRAGMYFYVSCLLGEENACEYLKDLQAGKYGQL